MNSMVDGIEKFKDWSCLRHKPSGVSPGLARSRKGKRAFKVSELKMLWLTTNTSYHSSAIVLEDVVDSKLLEPCAAPQPCPSTLLLHRRANSEMLLRGATKGHACSR